MSRKFSIIKTIDLDELVNQINKYINETKEDYPYLFIAQETLDVIPPSSFCAKSSNSKKVGFSGYWTGYKIFVDNTLKYGMVEIR